MTLPETPKAHNPYDLSPALISLVADDVEGHGHVVIFADDEPDQLQSLEGLYRRRYQVHTAPSAAAAMDLAESLASQGVMPAVLVSDQRMPDMTGIELLAHVRARHPLTARVLMTAYAEIGAVIDAINLGQVHRYVVKPLDPPELDRVLRETVGLSLLMQRFSKITASLF